MSLLIMKIPSPQTPRDCDSREVGVKAKGSAFLISISNDFDFDTDGPRSTVWVKQTTVYF